LVDDNPQLAKTSGAGDLLVWLKGDEVSSVLNFAMDGRRVVFATEYSTNMADFRLAASPEGRVALVWSEPDGLGSNLRALFYEPRRVGESHMAHV
jgi:hypothetical protein